MPKTSPAHAQGAEARNEHQTTLPTRYTTPSSEGSNHIGSASTSHWIKAKSQVLEGPDFLAMYTALRPG
jgi:hypothetical protein